MRKIGLLSLFVFATVITSCSVADTVSGTYKNGTWTLSGPGVTSNTGVSSGTLVVSPDGTDKVDMVFSSPGNPNVNIQDVQVTNLFGVYILDMSTSSNVNGTITQGILALTYDNPVDSFDLSLANFNR